MERQLTAANWTPDVVASILGTLFGVHAALLFLFIDLFIPYMPVRAFGLLMILLVAYAFNRIVFHMELTERRHFQQAFTMLIPVAIIYFTASLLAGTLANYIRTEVSNTIARLNPLNFLTGTTEAATTFSVNYQGPFIWTSILAFVIMLPFLLHAIRTQEFRPAWLLLLLIPAALCGLVALVTGAILSIVV